MKYATPDGREEYPLHTSGDPFKGRVVESSEGCGPFPYRTYDKNGNLIKEECHAPMLYEAGNRRFGHNDAFVNSSIERKRRTIPLGD